MQRLAKSHSIRRRLTTRTLAGAIWTCKTVSGLVNFVPISLECSTLGPNVFRSGLSRLHRFPLRCDRRQNGELWTGGMTTDRVVRLDPNGGGSPNTSSREHEHSESVCGQLNDAGYILGGQQPWCLHCQSRAVGLGKYFRITLIRGCWVDRLSWHDLPGTLALAVSPCNT